MALRDMRGRFRSASQDANPSEPAEPVKTTLVAVRLTGYEAELAHSVARMRFTTVSALIRAYLKRLILEEGHRLR